MKVGQGVNIEKSAYAVGGAQYAKETITLPGEVVFVSPHGWATVRFDCGYCECFYSESRGGIL